MNLRSSSSTIWRWVNAEMVCRPSIPLILSATFFYTNLVETLCPRGIGQQLPSAIKRLSHKAARRELISGGTPKARIQIKFRRRTDGDFYKIRVRGVKDEIAFDFDDGAWR
jgi:hypothetical protein